VPIASRDVRVAKVAATRNVQDRIAKQDTLNSSLVRAILIYSVVRKHAMLLILNI
jgi:multisubunit Na+/H+ antiporter MnhF subunit